MHATRKEDRRLSAALLAAALAHTPEAEEALRGARTRMARKPAALARELLRNFPKGRRGKSRRKRRGAAPGETIAPGAEAALVTTPIDGEDEFDGVDDDDDLDDDDLPTGDIADIDDIDDDDDDERDSERDAPELMSAAQPPEARRPPPSRPRASRARA